MCGVSVFSFVSLLRYKSNKKESFTSVTSQMQSVRFTRKPARFMFIDNNRVNHSSMLNVLN